MMTSSSSQVESNATRQYRESALQLTASCNSSAVSWQTSTHILDVINRLARNNEKKNRVVYVCRQCGYVIHPGCSGTILRVCRATSGFKTSRTLRRREQRKQRKVALARKKQASDTNRRNRNLSEENFATQFLLLDDEPSVKFDLRHLMIRCGRCNEKVRCKGMQRENSKSVKRLNFLSKTNVVHATTRSSDTLDFMQLPSLATSLTSQKRKKKKKDAPPKSKLLSFLNSLND